MKIPLFHWRWALLLIGWISASAVTRAGEVVINEIMYHPASERPSEEFVELFNAGEAGVNLGNWRLRGGIRFTFPSITLPPGGFLVVAAEMDVFRRKYASTIPATGPWEGVLSNSGDRITLEDAGGREVDEVRYADEGDWAVRRRGEVHFNHQGWVWRAEHDGGGKSLELMNASLDNEHGQNWAASETLEGTPGARNSKAQDNVAPLILETRHFPLVPRGEEPVAVTTRVIDEKNGPLTVTLFHRTDTGAADSPFLPLILRDDGLSRDGRAGDGVYGGELPPRPHGTVVEFHVEARDAEGLARTWPSPALDIDGSVLGQAANALYQVDDAAGPASQPLYRLVLTERERAELAAIGSIRPDALSDALMNATFISVEGGGSELRYLTGVKNRGDGSRAVKPNNYRINFRSDETWNGLFALNLNAQYVHAQQIGSLLAAQAGLPAAQTRAVQLRVNNANLALPGLPSFGSYAAVEVLDSRFADRAFPLDASGNVYRCVRTDPPLPPQAADFSYLGEDPEPYRRVYFKRSNASEDDWSDLIQLCRVLSASPDLAYVADVQAALDVRQWMRFLAFNAFIDNRETSLGNGRGDDYAMYRGKTDPRFKLIPYDLDTILGEGNQGGNPSGTLFAAAELPALNRFMRRPELVHIFFSELRRLAETVFLPDKVAPLFERFLSPYVPRETVDRMKAFLELRRAFVLTQLPPGVTATVPLPQTEGYYFTPAPEVSLQGAADPALTREVRVNGNTAAWVGWTGSWTLTNLVLQPGINNVLVQAFTEDGREHARANALIWWNRGTGTLVSEPVLENTVWRAEDGPFRVAREIVVAAGTTLSIGPGATVLFEPEGSLRILGRIIAEGTEHQRIRFTRAPGADAFWQGIRFEAGEGNLAFVDVEFSGASGQVFALANSTLTMRHCALLNNLGRQIDLENCSLALTHSRFGETGQTGTLRGRGALESGLVLVEGNIFAASAGDVLEFSEVQPSGPVVQIYNNVFEGGEQSGVRSRAANVLIEGNRFRNFHRRASQAQMASAVLGERNSELAIIRNLFAQNEIAVTVASDAFARAEHNTFVEQTAAVLAFEMLAAPAGRGGHFEACLFWNNSRILQERAPNAAPVELAFNRCLIPAPGNWPGAGNFFGEPRFRAGDSDFRLEPGSAALAKEPGELNAGAQVPAGATIFEGPPQASPSTEAVFRVTGPGVTHFRYKLNEGDYGEILPVATPLTLSGLAPGTHRIWVVGRNRAGQWQPFPGESRSWTVEPSAASVVINEVLALNRTAAAVGSGFPDLIELRNLTQQPVDLSGMTLTDDPDRPARFVFPRGQILPSGGYLVLRADSDSRSPGLSAGFALSQEGESLSLFASAEKGGGLLDRVAFGAQLPDLSIGRLSDGSWGLTRPSFGSRNEPERLGDPRRLSINEWLASSSTEDDFMELYNADPLPVSLGGLFVTDTGAGAPARQGIPPLTFIAGRGFRTLRNSAGSDPMRLVLRFGLASEQGEIGLFSPRLEEIDRVFYGPQPLGISEGRIPDGTARVVFLPRPTPGIANGDEDSDADQDGMPDKWEIAHGLNPIFDGDALLDADEDGHSNAHEFISGTDPMDPQSVLRLDAIRLDAATVRLRFFAEPNKSYVLERQGELPGGAWAVVFEISKRPERHQREFLDADGFGNEGSARFYRLRLLHER